eukprot:753382-Hanusia_phi.AAC.3
MQESELLMRQGKPPPSVWLGSPGEQAVCGFSWVRCLDSESGQRAVTDVLEGNQRGGVKAISFLPPSIAF